MQGLTQELMREIKPLLQTATVTPQPPTQPRRERRQPFLAANDWDEQGRPICCQCRQAGHIARFCRRPVASQLALN